MELSGNFSPLSGTELVTFVKIGTCNGTSYNFVPLEQNLTSYIWNGTFVTTGLQEQQFLEATSFVMALMDIPTPFFSAHAEKMTFTITR